MDSVAYLERMLEQRIGDLQSLPIPKEDTLSLVQACRLWNLCIKFQMKLESCGSAPASLLHDLCQLREFVCKTLSLLQPAEEMMRFWSRTAKGYIDCSEFQAATKCFLTAENCSKSVSTHDAPETWFNFSKWSLELTVKRDGNLGSFLPPLMDLVGMLPGERLNLCYFLYNEVACPLYEKKAFAHTLSALNSCILLTTDVSKHRIEDLLLKAKTLLCATYIELHAENKAKELIQQLPMDSTVLSLKVKIMINTNAMESFPDLIKTIIDTGEKCVETISEVLLGNNKLMDACKLLWMAWCQLQREEFILKWTKALFCLVTMDSSLENTASHLSTVDAIAALGRLSSCEPVVPYLWNLAIEKSHSEDFLGSNSLLQTIFNSTLDPSMRHQVTILLAQNLAKQGRLEESLETLAQDPNVNDGKVALLRLHVLLRMDAASVDTIVSTFACLTNTSDVEIAATEVLKSGNQCRLWPEAQKVVCAELVKTIEKQEDVATGQLVEVVKYAIQDTQDSEIVLEYMKACARWQLLTIEDRDWLHKKSWNVAISMTPNLTAYALFRLAEEISPFPDEKLKCILASCHICFTGSLSSKLTEAMTSLQAIKSAIPSSLLSFYLEVEFEGLILTNPAALAEHIESVSLSPEDLKTAAGVAFRMKQASLAAMCLKQYLQVAGLGDVPSVAAVYRELVSLASSADESFCYIEQAVKVANDKKYPKEELEWLLAVCWNNGVKSYRLDKLVLAERWMATAMSLVEKSESAYAEQMRKVYSDVLQQRYDTLEK